MTPRALMTATAVVLGAAGLALLFLAEAPGGQLWGAALLGLAALDWVGRGLVLGGIYGRPLVFANLFHFAIGALVCLDAAIDDPGAVSSWAAAAGYGVLALAFIRLLRRDPTRAVPS